MFASGKGNRYPGWQEWTDSTFEVHSAGPIEVGIDGEAMMLDPPIRFRSVPAASSATATARTRILAGRVEAATWAFRITALWRTALGSQVPIDA